MELAASCIKLWILFEKSDDLPIIHFSDEKYVYVACLLVKFSTAIFVVCTMLHFRCLCYC